MNRRHADTGARARLAHRAWLVLGLALALAGGVGRAQTVVLVRHAEKVRGAGDDPVLTAIGQARADSLAVALGGARVDAVFVTQYQRNRMTAMPLARAHHLAPVVLPVHDAAAHARDLAAAIRARPPNQTVVAIEHSNTIPDVIAALGGPRIAELCDAEYSTLFVLTLRAGGPPSIVRVRYGAADPAGATDCHRTPPSK